ncbi:MAG: hypothetical protein A3J74_06285 [Elusimicrobia bacterium RIFCSPHIGHO2_02_FULL_57_9]|nr:MAG: hypothetical protein A3J74_06285 [Elusimicrobia bacterium RIFCSPHIGHO2_02_FULL_57_9]
MLKMMTILMFLAGSAYSALAFEQNISQLHKDLNAKIASVFPESAADCPPPKPIKPWQGQITGAMNHSKTGVTLSNVNLYDFLEYFYLFLSAY